MKNWLRNRYGLFQRCIIACGVLTLIPVLSAAVSPAEFRELVAFDITLAALAEAAERDPENLLEDERIFIVDGVLGSVTIIDSDPEYYLVQLELVDGRWHGTERLDVYRVFVLAEGPEYARLFPARVSPDSAAEAVQRNERVLIAARVVNVFEDEFGGPYPVLEAYQIRVVR